MKCFCRIKVETLKPELKFASKRKASNKTKKNFASALLTEDMFPEKISK